MMKNNASIKTTTLNVVVFSVVSIFAWVFGGSVVGATAALMVLVTPLSESFLRVGSVLAGGVGVIVGAAVFAKKSGLKGIRSALLIGVLISLVKSVCKVAFWRLPMVSAASLMGVGITFVLSLAGAVIGSALRGK